MGEVELVWLPQYTKFENGNRTGVGDYSRQLATKLQKVVFRSVKNIEQGI